MPVTAIPFSDDLPTVPTAPRTIFYGSSNLMTNVHRARRWTPDVWFDETAFTFSATRGALGEDMLNADARVLTMEELAEETHDEAELLFLRPKW